MNKQCKNKPEIHESEINETHNNLQQLLLDAIWTDEPSYLDQCGFDEKGINVYRRNLLANAQRALSISFPTVFKLLDSDISERLVYQFLRSFPPEQGDWAQWGSSFSDFLASTEVGQNYPYLADCASVDWHVHNALNGCDQTLVKTSLQVLSDSEPLHIYIDFNQNVKLFHTVYPVADIFQAHNHEEVSQREASMVKAKKALASDLKEQVVMIYRPDFQPKVTTLTAGEGLFMTCLFSGQSLEQSLDAVKNDNDFSFEQWLITAINHNLIFTFKEKKLCKL